MAGLTHYERTHFHCNEHVKEFHREVCHRYICCTPFYHPLCNFDWRNEGQALIAERANSTKKPPEESCDNDSHSSWNVTEQVSHTDNSVVE